LRFLHSFLFLPNVFSAFLSLFRYLFQSLSFARIKVGLEELQNCIPEVPISNLCQNNIHSGSDFAVFLTDSKDPWNTTRNFQLNPSNFTRRN